jgi:hypothetical protein
MVEERELNETASMSCGIPIGSHKSYAHYPQVELCDVYSDPALRLRIQGGNYIVTGYE